MKKTLLMDSKIAAFEALLAQGQDNALLRYGLGNAYFQQKNWAVAITHYAKALVFDPEYSAVWKNYAKALVENQQIQEAIQAYTQGIVVAEKKGDKQTVKEMQVFLKRLQR
jgi:tetratricopeptide (TPR) repeat protein